MSNIITSTLDWFNKFSKRLKDLVLIIAIGVGTMFAINNGCTRNQLEKMFETTTGLSLENDLLLGKNIELDSTIALKDSLLLKQSFQIDSISKREQKALNKVSFWKGKHAEIYDDIVNLTPDSSDRFLRTVYNYTGAREYAYNKRQIKGMHQTYLENENKVQQIEAMELALFDCGNKYKLMDSKIRLTEDKFKAKSSQYNNSNKIISNKDTELNLYKKKLKSSKGWGTVKNVVIVVVLIVAAAFAL